jgi:cellulose synthase/poly-beta-1,6-N-acetylglucosamine synthase-like glycosyltransferase
MVVVFWISCAVVAYVYVGYPALLAVWARLRRQTAVAASQQRPPISIVLAARDEGARLGARLDNLLHLTYPAPRQIIVVSDGSVDDTLAVLEGYAPAIEVVSIEASGKASALNAGVARAKHDVLVFADARQTFAPDALLELTAPLEDPQVGAVTGELLLDGETPNRRGNGDRRASPAQPTPGDRRTAPDRRRTLQSTIAEGVGLYWRYEKAIRRCESSVASTLGATGCIYAMRRGLWTPLPAHTILDDVLAPMRAVLAGYRVVFNPRARAFDRAPEADAEARRKIRTLAGNYQILWLEPRLLLPWRNPVWAQYLSHKLGRLVVPYAMLTLIASSMALADRSIVYATALALQCAFYLLAAYGAWLEYCGSLAAARTAAPARGWPPAPARESRRGAINA